MECDGGSCQNLADAASFHLDAFRDRQQIERTRLVERLAFGRLVVGLGTEDLWSCETRRSPPPCP